MNDVDRQPGTGQADDAEPAAPGDTSPPAPGGTPGNPSDSAASDTASDPNFDESLFEELAAFVDDGRTYAHAELAFQKTRAKLAGQSVGIALACIIVALILLNIAFLALAVGLVIALAPLVTIWGAIAIVVGVLLLFAVLLVYAAMKRGKMLSAMFAASDEAEGT